MTGPLRILSFVLMLGLVLPACVKVFASPASASSVTVMQNSDGPDKPGKMPCITCCGNWTALLPSIVLPEAKRDPFAVLGADDNRPLPEVRAAIAALGPPPEWRLNLAVPHSYARMHARTERLLL